MTGSIIASMLRSFSTTVQVQHPNREEEVPQDGAGSYRSPAGTPLPGHCDTG